LRNELYFCLYLTQDEHGIVNHSIKEFCEANDLKLSYYRTLKEGHIACHRECKVIGNIGLLKSFLEKEGFTDNIVKNPHRIKPLID